MEEDRDEAFLLVELPRSGVRGNDVKSHRTYADLPATLTAWQTDETKGAVVLQSELCSIELTLLTRCKKSCLEGGPCRDRTCDLGIKSPLLYQLS